MNVKIIGVVCVCGVGILLKRWVEEYGLFLMFKEVVFLFCDRCLFRNFEVND